MAQGGEGRRRVKVSAAGPPSPPLISSISSNHCDRRRAREGESEQGRERGGPRGRSQEEAGEAAGEGDRENESKKRRVVKKRDGGVHQIEDLAEGIKNGLKIEGRTSSALAALQQLQSEEEEKKKGHKV